MTLIQLEYIIALDAFRHFGKAAEHCNISQPSLSAQIQKLEDELKTTIFSRNTYPITPTETGLIIIEQAKKIVSEGGMMEQIIQQQKNSVEGNLKIGIIPTLAPYLLPLFLHHFIEKYPGVQVSISDLTTENIIRQLKNGSLDTAILATPLADSELSEDFLFNEEFIAYISKKEEIFSKKYLVPQDIDFNKMWLAEEGHCLRTQALNLCDLRKKSSSEKHFDYKTGSIETLKHFVEKTGGLTLLPELCTIDMGTKERAMLRYFKSPPPVREISMVTLKGFVKTRLTDLLKNSIIEYLPPGMKELKPVNRMPIK